MKTRSSQSHLHLYICITNILPRQARDKQRESTQQQTPPFSQGYTDANGQPAGDYLGTLSQMDQQIGRLRQMLKDKGVAVRLREWSSSFPLDGRPFTCWSMEHDALLRQARDTHEESCLNSRPVAFLPFSRRTRHCGSLRTTGRTPPAEAAARGKETPLLRCHLHIKCIILPRQARDKHRESTQNKSGVSLGRSPAAQTRRRTACVSARHHSSREVRGGGEEKKTHLVVVDSFIGRVAASKLIVLSGWLVCLTDRHPRAGDPRVACDDQGASRD